MIGLIYCLKFNVIPSNIHILIKLYYYYLLLLLLSIFQMSSIVLNRKDNFEWCEFSEFRKLKIDNNNNKNNK